MIIRHHPSLLLLTDYVAGCIPLPGGLVVAAHLENCGKCRAQVGALEAAAGDSLAALDDVPVSDALLVETLARLQERPLALDIVSTRMQADAGLPAAVSGLGLRRRRWLGPGYWLAHVRSPHGGKWRAFLLCAPAGGRLPEHGHDGEEYISVLEGAYSDGRTLYRAGDFAQTAPGVDHMLEVTTDAPCVCLVATEAPIRWRGAAKLLRPIAGV